MVKKAISTIQKRKAGDKVGWKAEWLIEVRNESLEILHNSSATYGLIKCCVSTAKVNGIGEKVKCRIGIDMQEQVQKQLIGKGNKTECRTRKDQGKNQTL